MGIVLNVCECAHSVVVLELSVTPVSSSWKPYDLRGVLATAICVFYFSLQVLFVTSFWPINVYPDTPEMCQELCVGLHIEYPLFSSHLNQNRKAANILVNRKNFRASDLMNCCQHCSVVCMQTDRRTNIWRM